MYQHKE